MRHESDPLNIHEDMNRCAGYHYHTRARSNAIFRSKQHDSVYGRGLGMLRSGYYLTTRDFHISRIKLSAAFFSRTSSIIIRHVPQSAAARA